MSAKFRHIFLMLALMALAGLLSACQDSGVSNANAQGAAMPPPKLPVYTVQTHPVLVEDELPGRVAALRIAQVRPQVGGIIRRQLFTEGAQVKEGEPLYQIDPQMYQAEVAVSEANLLRAEASLRHAQRQVERNQPLVKDGMISLQNFDDLLVARDAADAEVALAKANLTKSRLNLEYATVTAPISGRIGASAVTEGALVSAGDPSPLAVIQQIDQVYVDLKQPAQRFAELREAIQAGIIKTNEHDMDVVLLSTTGRPLPERGQLLFSDISVNPGTGEVTLRVLVENKERTLLPGMFLRALIAQGEMPEAITIPQQAVQRDQNGSPQVFLVNSENKIELRRVEIGKSMEGRSLVWKGLADGERVVVEGQSKLRAGMTIDPTAWEAPSAFESAAPGPQS